jgi:hypothetical protein
MEDKSEPRTPRKNWNQKESMYLIQAWLSVSQDATVGTDQTGDRFWDKISNELQILKTDDAQCPTERNAKACKNRWGTVKYEVSKFQGHYDALKRNIKSGWNDKMYLEEALKTWSELPESKGKAFGLFYAWDALKDSPKWLLSMEKPGEKTDQKPKPTTKKRMTATRTAA